MKKYVNIYRAFAQSSFSKAAAYVSNFFMNAISSTLFSLLNIATIFLLTSQTSSINGWTRDEMILLALVYNIVRSVFSMFFQDGLFTMADTIFKGDLDSILLKPINSQFALSIRYLNVHAIVRMSINIVFLFYFFWINPIDVTLSNAIGFVALSIFGIVLLYAMWFMFMTTLIWNPVLTNIKDLLVHLTGLVLYPPDVFKQFGSEIFLIALPLVTVIAPATRTLIGDVLLQDALLTISMSMGMLYVSHLFWKFALKHYSSASS